MSLTVPFELSYLRDFRNQVCQALSLEAFCSLQQPRTPAHSFGNYTVGWNSEQQAEKAFFINPEQHIVFTL